MKTTITICDSCRCAQSDPDRHPRDGEKLVELIQDRAQAHPELIIARKSCLMGCDFACNIAIQSAHKMSYVLGGFAPDRETAAGIVQYAMKYHQSDSGQVPYRQWPQAIKGHFRARIPPLDPST